MTYLVTAMIRFKKRKERKEFIKTARKEKENFKVIALGTTRKSNIRCKSTTTWDLEFQYITTDISYVEADSYHIQSI